MAIIIIESIGFCATHSISDMLRINGLNNVSHGSKNFEKKTAMGIENLSFPQFLSKMIEHQDGYDNCISVHSNFNANDIVRTIEGTNAKFFGLMRKSQRKQILSCFYWAVNGFLNGRQDMTIHLIEIQKKYNKLLTQIGLSTNMNTCLMLWSYLHVINYNLNLSKHAQKLFFMEDALANGTSFAVKVGATTNNKFSLSVEQGPSHKNKVKDYEFLTNAEEVLETIVKKVNINFDNVANNFDDFEAILCEKSKLII